MIRMKILLLCDLEIYLQTELVVVRNLRILLNHSALIHMHLNALHHK